MAMARAHLVALVLLWATKGRAHKLKLQKGSCKPFLNGLIFNMEGRTANGSPYYKTNQYDYYMYYDRSCSKATDGQARWIIDDSKPRTDSHTDLDNDNNCIGHAHLSSVEVYRPPLKATWSMQCHLGNDLPWTAVELEFVELVPLDPTTTTPAVTTTERGPTYLLHLDGACAYQNYLNDMVFQKEGMTVGGSPYYKSQIYNYYIYYDPNCGAGTEIKDARWIIDNNRPDPTKREDLDNDKDCDYQARLNSQDSFQPPGSGTWRMRCSTDPKADWSDHVLTFTPLAETKTTTTVTTLAPTTTTLAPTTTTLAPTTTTLAATTTTPPTDAPVTTTSIVPGPTTTTEGSMESTTTKAQPIMVTSHDASRTSAQSDNGNVTITVPPAGSGSQKTLVFNGACDFLENLNGLKFEQKGTTANGAPFYKATTSEHYIYYDPSCAGPTSPQPARWILDNEAPDLKRAADLDNDGKCNYMARTDSEKKDVPPDSASWAMHCGDKDWQTLTISLQEIYAKVASGTCADAGRTPIRTASMCSAAAQYLRLSDTEPKPAEESESLPEGCYWDQSLSSLHLSLHSSSKGKGAQGSLEPICSDGGKDAQAMLSTAMDGHGAFTGFGLLLPTFTLALSCQLG